MSADAVKQTIEAGKAIAGIELGSTRIKTVLIDEDHVPIASGSYDWENKLDGHGPTPWRISGRDFRAATRIWSAM